MESKDIKRFYIMPEVWVTVTQSQVFNWIKLINDAGISTDCVSITNNKMASTDVDKIEKSIGGKFIQVHDFRRIFVSDIAIFFALFRIYLKHVFRYKKIVFQTRIGIGLAYYLMNWMPKVKLIFEARGAGGEESVHNLKGKKVSLKDSIKKAISIDNEKILLNKADRIICVSNALKNYYVNKFTLIPERFSVFPGAADADLFFNDQALRERTRMELEAAPDDIVVVYSGRLEMSWEIPDKIFEFFNDLHRKNSKFKLLLITPDVDLAKEFIAKNEFKNCVYALKCTLEQVNNYLNASDVGLLLREDVVMNNVASPTKFAEYLMAGLPVLISNSIHDFANDIKSTGFGAVVNDLDMIADEEFKKLETSLSLSRTEIAKWGKENLSKEGFIEKYVKLFKEI